jgi:hypothetical protein
MHTFPDQKVARNYKTKERAIVDLVRAKFPDFDWKEDQRVHDGCSKRRPDMLLHLGDQVIIIEIDENQHRDYDCSCENKRLMELSRDVGHRPLVFIRFNPDDYIDAQKSNITSCWGVNGHGILVIKKKKLDEWNQRTAVLLDMVTYWVEHRTNKTVEVIQLFYDHK